jgi:hypothetical protein
MSIHQISSLTTLRRIDDHENFSRLPARVQKLVIVRLDWILQIEDAPHGKRGEIAKQAAAALGCSVPTVGRFVRSFRTGGWQALIDMRGKHVGGLPEAFKGYVKQLHLQFQRSNSGREVQRQLIERWQLWQQTGDQLYALPGFDSPPPAGPKGYPVGFSEDTILRLKPDNYALALVRQGAKSAAGFLPSILSTRHGLAFGEVVMFDDQQYDVRVAARGTSQRVLRPEGFNCIDYLSGCFMSHAIRLRWWDIEADQSRTLSNQEFTWFVISYLQRHGYRSDERGTTFVFEHGTANGFNNRSLTTAAGFSNFDEALAAVSLGNIRVQRSGLFNAPAFSGMLFRPQSSGNPNHKAPLESMFQYVRNRMAALPGATGRNRDEKPAEQYGMDLYTGQLLKLYERLDERHRELIRFPVMTAAEFGTVAAAVYDAINARTDHELEGWEKCGFVAPQFRWTPDGDSPWLPRDKVMALPEDARAALLAKAEIPGHIRTHKLSPAEVARQHAGELTRLPDHAIPLLLPIQWARPATVKSDRTIAIKDQMMGPEAFQYVARFEGRDGTHTLKPGTTVLCYLNPFAPERMVICREDGSFLGTLTQQTRSGFLDQAAILDQLKTRAAMKADLDADVRPHLQGMMAERAEMKNVNARLAAGKPVMPDEIAEARSEAGKEGQRTAAANRLQSHGSAIDWDNFKQEEDPSPGNAFDELPDGFWDDDPSDDSDARAAWDDLPEDWQIPEAL